MRAFIIRPFEKKKDLNGNEIDFDEVARVLIDPALSAIGAEGRETLDIVKSGNIRIDMFRRLLTADLVVADLSIHNANIFYELGIRHALREHGTFMLRCDADKFPFDLQTDRYFTYNKENPAASLPDLISALKSVMAEIQKDYTAKDSPVFMSLPNLTEPESSRFNPVPQDFGEEVTRAKSDGRAGDLALFSNEVKGFEWEQNGWRTVGRAQFDLKSYASAKVTWEYVRRLEPSDLESNILLGTIYERLGDLTRSTQALDRAIENEDIQSNQRAEVYALLGRNAKTRWRDEWVNDLPESRVTTSFRSPHLRDSFENYRRAFEEDLNHFYSGLNALAMLSILIELATKLPNIWNELFETDEEAEAKLGSYKEDAAKLAATVDISLQATRNRLKRDGKKDVWAEISNADLRFITSKRPSRVATAYRDALVGAPDFARDSVLKQLLIYKDLGVLTGNLTEVENVVGVAKAAPTSKPQQRKRVLLFAGHMIDAPGREHQRFPPDREDIAREKIKEAVMREMQADAGVSCGYAGAASGGDILFQEVCLELGIPTKLYLAIPAQKYVSTSVDKAGQTWVQRFWKIHGEHAAQNQVRVLGDTIDDEGEYLPAWLRSKPKYSIWQRNNLWMLFNALDEGCDPKTGDPNISLIALWDGAGGDGPGGTGDLVDKVKNLGARCEIINTKEVFKL
ncbi:MAG TPA: tetratricopeptide repeat-containing protein [Pyrinomonadaceae bacterium]|nr:tetratricopeptide repeat-containing protein [Pyrinomonadaceae bacterium]